MSLAPLVASFRSRFPLIVRAVFAALLRVLAPPRCAACDVPTTLHDAFCPACERTVKLDSPSDPALFVPSALPHLAYAIDEGALSRAVRRFKYGDRPDLAAPLAARLCAVLERAALRCDLVIPVPLHARKLRDRGYNQTALLASIVARAAGARFLPRALERTRDTESQASLSRAARLTNLACAFRVRDPLQIKGKRVLLIDDVATTGSTLRACLDPLVAAGASHVTTLVLARRPLVKSRDPG